jgi:DNA-binding transcriptional LysR family regulator
MADLRSLSLRQLRAFAATIRNGSVTAAAQELCVTPPAVTTQLKILERSVGAPIYTRDREGLEATPIGLEILEAANDMDAVVERCRSRIEALQAGATGAVTLGVVSTGKYFAPRLVAAFMQAYPNIRVHLSIGNRDDIISGLERRQYDLAIMGRPPKHIEVAQDTLGDHPYVLVAQPDSWLIKKDEITAQDLAQCTFLTREEGSGTRTLMWRFLDRLESDRPDSDGPFHVYEMGTNETIKQAVMAGLGVAIISGHTVHTELAEGKLAAVHAPGLPITRQWYLIRRADRDPTNTAQVFHDFVLSRRGDYLPKTPVEGA